MEFEEFWSFLKKELHKKRKFSTLQRHKEFSAYFNDKNSITIIPKEATKGPYFLGHDTMLYVWNVAKNIIGKEKYKVNYYRNKIGTSSYAVTLLYHYSNDKTLE